MAFSSGQVLTAAQLNDLSIDSITVDTSTLVVDKTNNRVGIGTASPQRLLDLRGASNPEIRLQSTDGSDTAIYFGDESDAVQAGIFYDNSANTMFFRGYDNSSRMSIDSNGNFKVVTGIIESDGTYANTTSSGANMHISSSGYFFRSTSSEKYKTDIETLEDDYADAILNLRPVWYKSLCENDNKDFSYWGFIAEEVAEIDPRLVHYGVEQLKDENGELMFTEEETEDGMELVPVYKRDTNGEPIEAPEGVQYERLTPLLLNLIQRLTARVEALEK